MRQQESLLFNLALTGTKKHLWSPAGDKFSQQFIHSLGLKVESGCWSRIDLASPKFAEFLQRAEELIAARKATFYGNCQLIQRIADEDNAEWFQITGKARAEVRNDNNGATCDAYKMKSGAHFASGNFYNQYVSARVKEVVERHRLSGIEFVWLPDTGKFRAPMQWYIPVATVPLGRGVDHPWFDPRKLDDDSMQPASRDWRMGVYRFDVGQIRKGASLDRPEYKRLFKLFAADGLTIVAPRMFLRGALPKTDFAFNWHQEDEERDGEILKQRGLCVNRKTRDILLREKLVRPDEIEATNILDKVPDECEKLDGRGKMPEPLYTSREIAALAKKLEPRWKRHLETQKPVRTVQMKESLSMLRAARRDRPGDFRKGISAAALAKLKPPLPANWKALLAITNGGMLDEQHECRIVPAADLPALIKEFRALVASLFDKYPFDCLLIPVARAADGDWFCLEDKRKPGEESRVFRVTHDNMSVERAWESIAMFVHDALSGSV